MLISLHKQATTTPKIRAAIQASSEPAWRVAERYGISEQTVWKWRGRDDVHDRSHTPHRLQTTLTPAQEAVAVALRKALLLPLDDLLAVVREFLNPNVSRSGLDRCLRRHGDRLLRRRQRRLQAVRRVAPVVDVVATPPFPDRLLGDPVALRHQPGRFAARLDRGPDLRCRGGLLVQRNQHARTPSRTSRRIDLAMNRADRRGSM